MSQGLVERLAFRAAMPLVVAQGLWVKLTASRYVPAAGPREGSAGEGEPLRLLAIGDSIVAGIGVRQLSSAMPGQLARAIAARLGRRVEWVARGLSGIGARAVRRQLVPSLPDIDFDVLFVSVGVNDVTALRSSAHWKRELSGLVGDLRARAPRAAILVSGLPPLHGFPLLPQPLRAILGMRAQTFDRMAEELVSTIPGTLFVPNRFEPSPAFFAPDGYHPSEESCAVWAGRVAEILAVEGRTRDLAGLRGVARSTVV